MHETGESISHREMQNVVPVALDGVLLFYLVLRRVL
jgi:hypothetical protein